MAVLMQEGATTTHAETGTRLLPEHLNKHTLADWKDSAASYVRQQLFDKKQFITDMELMFGGTIQKLVCSDINICDGRKAQIFWNEKGGRETVRSTFRKKRQSAQNSMKLAFRGKKAECADQNNVPLLLVNQYLTLTIVI
jgi:serine/threonine-protein kinase RIO1